jgi:hypothetical protein
MTSRKPGFAEDPFAQLAVYGGRDLDPAQGRAMHLTERLGESSHG